MDRSWIEELERRRAEIRAPGPKVEKLHAEGKLSARERLDILLDPGSFSELGTMNRSQSPALADRTPADGLVAGWGRIDGRVVYVMAEDGAVFAGTRGKVASQKARRIRQLALEHNAPFIELIEAGALRFQESGGAIAAGAGYRFPDQYRLSGRVPLASAMMGQCFGGPSFTAVQGDFTTIVKGTGFMGMSGPPLVKVGLGREVTAEEIGGAEMSATVTGQADHMGETETDSLQAIRRFLSYFPANADELPPRAEPRPAAIDSEAGAEKVSALVPENQRRAYDMRVLVEMMVDGGEVFDYRGLYGQSLICCWARIDGEVVGIMANQPMKMGGALDERAAHKGRKFVDICDAFHIPLVFLCDCPGFMIGPDAERQRMVSNVTRYMNTLSRASVPRAAVIIRKAIGLGYQAMCGRIFEPDTIVAWPTAQFDLLAPAAGVELANKRRLSEADDPDALRVELLAEAERLASGYRAAEMGLIDEVIAPAETREVIRGVLERARASRRPGFKHAIDP